MARIIVAAMSAVLAHIAEQRAISPPIPAHASAHMVAAWAAAEHASIHSCIRSISMLMPVWGICMEPIIWDIMFTRTCLLPAADKPRIGMYRGGHRAADYARTGRPMGVSQCLHRVEACRLRRRPTTRRRRGVGVT